MFYQLDNKLANTTIHMENDIKLILHKSPWILFIGGFPTINALKVLYQKKRLCFLLLLLFTICHLKRFSIQWRKKKVNLFCCCRLAFFFFLCSIINALNRKQIFNMENEKKRKKKIGNWFFQILQFMSIPFVKWKYFNFLYEIWVSM